MPSLPGSAEYLFCIFDRKVHFAPPGAPASYLAWFRLEGWIGNKEGDEESFFRHVVNGSYIPSENALYCFREADISPHAEVLWIIGQHLPALVKAFGLKDDTRVFLGPRAGGLVHEKSEEHYVGTLHDLRKKLEEKERKMEEGMR